MDTWVFGMVDTSKRPALGYMEVVQQKTAATLLPVINSHVAPGTVVQTDEWRSYRRVSSLPCIFPPNSEPFGQLC